MKFNNFILKDENLTLEEGYMLQVLFQFYNIECGYAYPTYTTLKTMLFLVQRIPLQIHTTILQLQRDIAILTILRLVTMIMKLWKENSWGGIDERR